jgi:uncharacterized protein (TIGR02453 family)
LKALRLRWRRAQAPYLRRSLIRSCWALHERPMQCRQETLGFTPGPVRLHFPPGQLHGARSDVHPMAHFTRATFRFLRELAQSNDTTWFHAHRDEYERHVRGPANEVATQWNDALPRHYVGAGAGGRAVSPPNRDIRFSRDKAPYRTHVAIRLRHRLALPGAPGPTFLLWIDPRGSFLSAGVRNVSGEVRRRIVASIVADPSGWSAARDGLDLSADDLFATAPPAPDAVVADLHRRHFTAEIPLSQRILCSESLVGELTGLSQRLLPLNEFLAEALYGEGVLAPTSP